LFENEKIFKGKKIPVDNYDCIANTLLEGNMSRDWYDIAMVTGWISAWGVLIYMIPPIGL